MEGKLGGRLIRLHRPKRIEYFGSRLLRIAIGIVISFPESLGEELLSGKRRIGWTEQLPRPSGAFYRGNFVRAPQSRHQDDRREALFKAEPLFRFEGLFGASTSHEIVGI